MSKKPIFESDKYRIEHYDSPGERPFRIFRKKDNRWVCDRWQVYLFGTDARVGDAGNALVVIAQDVEDAIHSAKRWAEGLIVTADPLPEFTTIGEKPIVVVASSYYQPVLEFAPDANELDRLDDVQLRELQRRVEARLNDGERDE